MTAPGRGGRLWPQHDRQLSASAEQARAAARHARESLRWNLRAWVSQEVPRPDGAVLSAPEELTTRTRAVARSLLDTSADGTASRIPASFGEQYARLLRVVADAVRQLADQPGHIPPSQELAALPDIQHHAEHQAACLVGRGDGHVTAQQLSRLSAEMMREIGRPRSDGRTRPAG